ncbi:MAG TPA: divergent polysaccharide deacetylase family protein [Bradyrhizobium sp.]|uniref:divergent polysaccharide deacetylase family protein n=1 Tax=Bradyrhizobium sp. TaxID=376 RepID=UPI002D7ECA27|nr:divergent polysaccharide deacetylase family protein [Bradyrhizobium sp.]HET7884693.1 divergent polysaccharide deacetylase family protein [Bradyrhizobium sp.]
MAEAADELSAPLGREGVRRKRRFRLPFTGKQLLAALLGLFLATFAGYALFHDDPLGGEPRVGIAIAPPTGADKAAAKSPEAPADKSAHQAEPAHGKAGPAAEQRTVTIIDGSSGARHDVTIGGGETTDRDAGASPAVMSGIDPRLLEKSRYGMIPTAADGLKPVTVYAGEADRAKAAKMPIVAIVVGGLGVGAAKTVDAILKLPAAVTLAFTPYGSDPGKLVERARAQHHEILLQIPMEPYDYPDNDPGPQTLLTTLAPEQNIDRLYWHLSRFQGYAGIANFMGARFVATDTAMGPIVKEAAKRGLGLFDDGAARSVAPSMAATQAVPFAKADVAIDAVPTSGEIDRALAKLEGLAKERGMAVGVASALPISIERISAWTRTLDSRGLLLVPLTTAMLKSKSS